MKQSILLSWSLLVILGVLSCKGLFPKISHDNYFSLQKSSIYLIERMEEDTICYRTYDLQYDLPGEECALVRRTNVFSKEKKIGVSIRYSIRWIAALNGAPYGPNPNLGNIDSITSLKVEFISEPENIDISASIEGDSSLMKYLWEEGDSEPYKLARTNIMADKCCYEAHRVSSLEALRLKLNQQPNDLEPDFYDYIFWMDMKVVSQFESRVAGVQLTTILVDSLGRERELIDIALLK